MNGGEEADAPICLAVQSRNKLMVDFLLQQGVHNVHRCGRMWGVVGWLLPGAHNCYYTRRVILA